MRHLKATIDYRTLVAPFSGVDSLTGFVSTSTHEDLRNNEKKYLGVADLFFTNPIEVEGDYRQQKKKNKAILIDWYGKLNDAFVQNHDFSLSEIIYDDFGQDSIYVVKVLPSRKTKKMLPKGSYKIPLGKMFVHAEDFAILRYEYGIYANPKKKTEVQKAVNYNYRIEADYIKIEDKYYLNYLKKEGLDMANYMASADPAVLSGQQNTIGTLVSNTLGTFDLLVSFEFYASSFETDSRQANDTFYSFPKGIGFYEDVLNIKVDGEFWESYTYPPESERARALRLDLEKRIEKKTSQN